MPEFGKIIEHIRKNWALLLGAIYIAGFTVWNRFLSNFGFFEYSFLQTKFISAGILAILSFYLIYSWKLTTRNNITVIITFLIYIFIIFPSVIFPLIPASFGGGMPIMTSLIDTPDEILHLENDFNIPKEPNADGAKPSVQTRPLCLFFARENLLIIGPAFGGIGRIVILPRDRGFSQSLVGFWGREACYEYIWPKTFHLIHQLFVKLKS